MNDLTEKLKKASEESLAKAGIKEEPNKKEVKKEEVKEKTIFDKLKEKGINAEKDDDILLYIDNERKRNEDVLKSKELEFQEKSKGYGEFDPMSLFSSVESYKAEQLKKNFPTIGKDIAERIITTDVSKLESMETIALSMLVDNPDLEGGLQGAIELVKSKYGIHDDEELTPLQKNQMKVDSKLAVSKLNELKAGVKDPEKINIQAIRDKVEVDRSAELKKNQEDWTRESDSLVSKFDKFVITDKVDGKEEVIFTLDIEGDFKEKVKKDIPKYFSDNNIPVNEETLKYAERELYETYFRENRVKILKNYARQYADKEIERIEKEYAGMGHVRRDAGGKSVTNEVSEQDKNRMIYGNTDNAGIKKLNYKENS